MEIIIFHIFFNVFPHRENPCLGISLELVEESEACETT